jgi:hypothetical protein
MEFLSRSKYFRNDLSWLPMCECVSVCKGLCTWVCSDLHISFHKRFEVAWDVFYPPEKLQSVKWSDDT